MLNISTLIPDAEILLKLSQEELGRALLKVIDSLPEGQRHRPNYLAMKEATSGYPPSYAQRVMEAQNETWEWLRQKGYIAPRPENTGSEFIYVTERGRSFLAKSDS